MKIVEKNGDLLESTSEIICHQVNCRGIMGSGVANALRKKWPLVFEQYSYFIKANVERDRVTGQKLNTFEFLGLCQIVKVGPDKFVANLFGQDDFGNDKQYTDYTALEISLYNLKRLIYFGGYNTTFKSIAFPYKLGCGRGGGDWNIVLDIIKKVFNDTDITIEIIKRGE